MHSSLRPELRGSQRVLKSLRKVPAQHSHRRPLRPFSSFRRLQQASDSNDSNSGSPQKPKPSDQGISSFLPDPFRNFFTSVGGFDKQDGQDVSSNTSFDTTGISSLRDVIDRSRKETEHIDQFLRNGQIPPGFRRVESLQDLPDEWRIRFENENAIKPPFLFADDPEKIIKTAPLPENFQGQRSEENGEQKEGKLAPFGDNFLRDIDGSTGTQFYGSSGARRMRARAAKSQGMMQKALPSWFFEHNILTGVGHTSSLPRIELVRRSDNGNYVAVAERKVSSDGVQLEVQRDSIATESNAYDQAFGTGGSSDTSTPPTKPNMGENESRTIQTDSVSLPNRRYFVEEAQYTELLTTVNGRLHRPAESTPRGLTNSMAVGNLTVDYAAPNAEILLNCLVQDIARRCDAKYASIDIQDMSTLIAKADVDSAIADKGSKLSYRVYEDLYSTSLNLVESASNNEDDELDVGEEDEGPPGMQPDIPTIHIPIGIGDFSKAMSRIQGGGQRSFGGSNNIFSRFLGGDSNGSDTPGLFSTIVDSVLTSISQKKVDFGTSKSEQAHQSEQARQPSEHPTIIHIQNYRAIHDQNLSAVFLTELCHQVERRVANGQKIMVLGTDCLRHYQVQKNAEEILEEQDKKSFGVSSDIIITPTFPTKDAEMVLVHDRQRRIRMINARHLWNVLQIKGITLQGLQGGFWTKEQLTELGEADNNALSKALWSFNYTQRIAALIAGSKDSKSQSPIADAIEKITTSDQTKVAWAKRNQPDQPKDTINEQTQSEDKRLAKIRAKATRHEKRLLSGVVEPRKISTTFNDIHIPAETVDALQTLTALSLVRPEAFRYGVLKSDRIPGLLLYGPPGTGKTLAAKAVAKESGATMLEVSAADLNDMYVGEGEKNVQALFSLAKKLSPCVVFLDEADAMFSARAAQGRRVSHRELLNQFLKEWDGMSNDAGSAFIMVATNRPMDLDDAVLRRLPRRLLVDLPTENDRFEILKIHLRHENLADDVDLAKISSRTAFYSGSDLKNVAVAAALNCVREENEAAKKHDAKEPYQYPERRTLKAEHFAKALEDISASISEDMSSLKDIKKFDEQYGDKRGRKKKAGRWGFRSPSETEEKQDTVKVRS